LSSSTRSGIAWAFFASLMAACYLVPWKVATEHGAPAVAVLVMLVSAATWNSVSIFTPAGQKAADRPGGSLLPTLQLALVFSVLTLLGNWSSAEAVARISGPLLAVIQRSEVILVGLFGMLLLREPVGPSFWAGTGVAALGLYLLQRPDAAAGDFDPVGALFGLGAAACFGIMVLLSRAFIGRVRLIPFNALRLWLSVGLWFVVHRRVPSRVELAPGLVLNATLAGFFGPYLSRIGALQSARHVPANVTSVAALATPVLTLFLTWLVLGALPTERELLGGAIMLLGVALPVGAVAWTSRAAGPDRA